MLIFLFVVFLGTAIIGVPTAFALLIPSVVAMFVNDIPILLIAQRMIGGLYLFVLLAVPFFILTANAMNESKATDQLIRLINSFIGRVPGGLAYVNVIVSMIFGGISGSSTADTGGIGSVLIPAMKKEGYPEEVSVAVTSCSSTLGEVIPPSIIMIIIGAVLNVSIGALFIGGIIPGILIGCGQMAVIFFQNRKYGFPRDEESSLRDFLTTGYKALPVLGAPIIIIGGILTGWFTPTEAGAVGSVYGILCGVLFFRTLNIRNLIKILVDTIRLASLSLFCLSAAAMFGWFLAYYKLPDYLAALIFSFTTNKFVILAVINLVFLLVGCFLDAVPAILIILPIIFPTAVATGIHPVHLGVIISINLAMGLITPPYGLCLLLAAKIANIPVERAIKGLWPYFIVMLAILMIVTYFPEVVLFLPRSLTPHFM